MPDGRRSEAHRYRPITLSVDIGGTGIKAMLLDRRGRPVSEPLRAPTPRPARPAAVLDRVRGLARRLPGYRRVSVGFPGVVEAGTVRTAVNLHGSWIGVRLDERLRTLLRAPVRVANDADVQGLALIERRGVELVLTLGTGVGSALFLDGRLLPNLELGHHPFRRGRTYEDLLRDSELRRVGRSAWKRRLRAAVELIVKTFHCRRLYLGGGNARLLSARFHPRVEISSNVAGLLGGIHLWEEAPRRARSRGQG